MSVEFPPSHIRDRRTPRLLDWVRAGVINLEQYPEIETVISVQAFSEQMPGVISGPIDRANDPVEMLEVNLGVTDAA